MLKTEYPDLAKEWDNKANDEIGLDFGSVTPGSNKVAWWTCPKGHKYSRRVYERTTKGYGCPYCSGRQILPGFNDLAAKFPMLLAEWDYEKNTVDPHTIGVGFRPKVWWICPKGHSYHSVIYPRTQGSGCPYCAGKKVLAGYNDITTTNPELLDTWDYERNTVKPTEVSRGYNKRLYWKCDKGHSYDAKVIDRIRGLGCHYCSHQKALPGVNDLFTLYPALKVEWDYEKNDIDPTTIVRGGMKKFWWKCSKGHSWQSRVTDRLRNDNSITRCPTCSQKMRVSLPEKMIYFYVHEAFPDAVENYKAKWLGKKELDIYIPSLKVGIEYDGEHYHSAERDLIKDKLCRDNDVKLIRIREQKAAKIKSSSIVYSIPERWYPDGRHIVGALEFLEKELGKKFDFDLSRDQDKLRALIENYDIDNCVAKTNPELLSEWDYEKNEKLGYTPDNVSRGASCTLYWVCPKGHGYKATLPNRINGGTGCPYCSVPPRKILVGFNDLATTAPEILERWDYEKNTVKPTEITRFSNRKVWLKCDKGQNHSYDVSLLNADDGGCPYCSGHRVLAGFNDLATTNPELLDEWDYEKNKVKPTEVGKGQARKVWWVCVENHSYEASIVNRVKAKSGCPYCSGRLVLAGFNDVATTNPEILDVWDYEKNKIRPTEIGKGSEKKVWLKCEKGHSYETIIMTYLSGSRCSYCAGRKVLTGFNDVATTDPVVLKVWNDDNYSPNEITRKSPRVIECMCPKCGYRWQTRVYNLTKQKRCKGCKTNLLEL